MPSPATTQWVPLLEGTLAGQAHRAITEVSHALVTLPEESGRPWSYRRDDAGFALLWAYQSLATGSGKPSVEAEAFLERAIETLSSRPLTPALHGGFTGIAWAVQHLRPRTDSAEQEDASAEVDTALLDYLGQTPWRSFFDLISGLAGLAIYALERLPRPGATACLERIVARLDELAVGRPEGVTWWTPPEPRVGGGVALKHRDFPHGCHDLGVAHGVPGVIAVLAQVAAAGVATERASTLAREGVRWLLAQRLPSGNGICFPSFVGEGIEPAPSRDAWCYGDPGIAITLLLAARALGEPDWEREALELARGVARRPRERMGVVDAGLCHGSAGLAHIFNRFFQATGEELFREAAVEWYRWTLETYHQPGEGIGGFRSWRANSDGTWGWQSNPGLLSGSTGVALALLAATTPVEPAWDRLLLTNVPPRRAE